MANVVGRIVRSFSSLDYGQWNTGNHASSVRRSLDTPRLLLNMMHNDDGQLWMPPAPSEFVTSVSGTGDLYLVRQTFEPIGTLIVQKGPTVSLYQISTGSIPFSSADATFTLDDDEKIWTLAHNAKLYFGNSTQTVRVTYSAGYTVTDITAAGIPDGYHSMMYRNRRFVVERVFGTEGGVNERLHYSDIGDPETFGANAYIDIEAYYEGDSWENALGSPIAAHSFGDVLAVFQTQGIVRFTGTDPETNFTLRPTMSSVGAWMRDSIADTAQGLIFFGGTPRGEFGFYLFTGNSSQLISGQLNGYLRKWVESGQSFSEDRSDSCVWRNRYIVALDVGVDPTIYVYDWQRQNWSTFDGWTRPTVGLVRKSSDRICFADSDETTVYSTTSPMARATATTTARFRVGYEDEDQPSGLVRFQTLRLTVHAKIGGSGFPVSVAASLPDNVYVFPPQQTITETGQHTLEFPLKVRGNSIDLDVLVSPTHADDEITFENLELVQSRKSLKVPRVGGHIGPSNTEPSGLSLSSDVSSELVADGSEEVSTTLTMPATVNEGDLLVVNMFADNLSSEGVFPASISQSLSGDWTVIHRDETDSIDWAEALWIKVADADDAAGTSSYTATLDNTGASGSSSVRVTPRTTCVTGFTDGATVGPALQESSTFSGSNFDPTWQSHTVTPSSIGNWVFVTAWAWRRTYAGSRDASCEIISPSTEVGSVRDTSGSSYEITFGFCQTDEIATCQARSDGLAGTYYGGIHAIPASGS